MRRDHRDEGSPDLPEQPRHLCWPSLAGRLYVPGAVGLQTLLLRQAATEAEVQALDGDWKAARVLRLKAGPLASHHSTASPVPPG